jgi:hypothetical protein
MADAILEAAKFTGEVLAPLNWSATRRAALA